METDQIWPLADFITVHTPLIPATKGLLHQISIPIYKKTSFHLMLFQYHNLHFIV